MAHNLLMIGKVTGRGPNEGRSFGIPLEDLLQHVWVFGSSGTGKSRLLEAIARAHADAGRGFGVVDPHGPLADAVLNQIALSRANQVVYFDPTDEWPVSLNLLEGADSREQALIASRITSTFKGVFGTGIMDRSEDLIRNAVGAIVGIPKATLLWIPKLLVNKDFLTWLLPKMQDPIVRDYWEKQYLQYPEKDKQLFTAAIQNKLRSVLTFPCMRNVVAQYGRTITMQEMMDKGMILVAKVDKGRLGNENAAMLATLIANELYLSSLARSAASRPWYAIFDETGTSIKGDVLEKILSESRKFGLSLTGGLQYLDQMEASSRKGVFGNVGTLIAFRVSGGDAEILARELGSPLTPTDFHLPNRHAYIRMSYFGQSVQPFSMMTTDTPQGYGNAANIIRTSRERWGRPVAHVESAHRRFLQ